jgi:hypothetical protein
MLPPISFANKNKVIERTRRKKTLGHEAETFLRYV